MKDISLSCTSCKKKYFKETTDFRCEICHEPLELKEVKDGGINKNSKFEKSTLQRYADFYPFININSDVSLGEGFTSLLQCKKLEEQYCVENLYFKNESENPTWSFKDRGTITGILRALDLGYTRIGTVSSGNMATSVAAYGARANLETFILVKDNIVDEKLKPIAIYGSKLIKINGDYGKIYDESFKIGEEKGIYFINSDIAYRIEGYKTIAFEICEQLNFNVPDYVVVPTSAGGNIRGIEKGFREFKNVGLIKKIPKMICVQAEGCSPIYNAFINNDSTVKKFEEPNTIAHAIGNPTPPSGNQVLRIISRNGGTMVSVNEEEIINAQKEVAKIGVFVQPASATSLAAVKKLKSSGYISESDRIVCILTSSGLKFTGALQSHDLEIKHCDLQELRHLIN